VIAAASERVRLSDNRIARWRRIVVEACKQSGRRWVPAIERPMAIAEARPSGVGWLLDREDARPLATALGERPPAVSLLVGPESGLSADELGTLERAGWARVSLGPRVLRTETAGAIATALVLHAWSDLGR
jgi:16S rRNA (uracil1498-N3)-methyltransferase